MRTNKYEFVLLGFKEAIGYLRSRRGMYIRGGLDTLVAFLVGYSEAVKRNEGLDLMSLVQDYVRHLYGRDFAQFWPYYLKDEVAQNEHEYEDLVFDCLESFLLQHLDQHMD